MHTHVCQCVYMCVNVCGGCVCARGDAPTLPSASRAVLFHLSALIHPTRHTGLLAEINHKYFIIHHAV